MTDCFLPKNCSPDVTVDGNSVKYTKGGWNTAYGNLIIDPQKQPNATYSW